MTCIRKFIAAIGLVKAFLSRLLFSVHGLICIWRVYVVKREPLYWCLTITIGFLVIEAIVTLRLRKGEWKCMSFEIPRLTLITLTSTSDAQNLGRVAATIHRFCPSVFLFLATAIPAIWFLELDLLYKRLGYDVDDNQAASNVTHDDMLGLEDEIQINLEPDAWVKILEQMLMLVLIIGRWLLPKGEISREQLSQLLLVYIGMAADIIELFEAFKEDAVKYNEMLIIITLALWTGSLMQFTFVVTASKSKRPRPVMSADEADETIGSDCCPIEVVSIIISVVLQDGPFFGLRMSLIFYYNVLSYSNIFFTSKNGLVLVLQIYRLIILYTAKAPSSPPSSSYSNGSGDSENIISSCDDNGGNAKEMAFAGARKRSQTQPKRIMSISPDLSSSDTMLNDVVIHQERHGPKTTLVKKKHAKGHGKRGSYNAIMSSSVERRDKDRKPKSPKISQKKPAEIPDMARSKRQHSNSGDSVILSAPGKISRKVQCDRDNSVDSGSLFGTREMGIQVNRKSLEKFVADILSGGYGRSK